MNDSDSPRRAFTPGWSKNLSEKEALPIKSCRGKIIRVLRQRTTQPESDEHGKTNDIDANETIVERIDEYPCDDEYISFNGFETKPKKEKKDSVVLFDKTLSFEEIQVTIGRVCTDIVADPEYAVKKKRDVDQGGDVKPKLLDLLLYLKHTDPKVRELAMLSTFLVFKDICPSYRIRLNEGADKEIQLKKETKKLRDFELGLLSAYQSYLKYLDKVLSETFGKSTKNMSEWDDFCGLALTALRCQCELLLCMTHFNNRSQLISSIVFYAAHSNTDISSMCCLTIQRILQQDQDGDTAFEVVKTVNQVIISLKYEVSESFLRVLEHARLQVHSDDAKNVRRKAKADRRKRRRQSDDVEIGLLEADATSNVSIAKRFQADCLHEISLIYFRIIKMKIGFRLLPVALHGLGRITHLLDMDTVLDLLVVMRRILQEATPPAPPLVRLLCVHCGLRTLTGPGQELGSDEDVYITALRQLMGELPSTFNRWDIVFESIDYCMLRRTEPRNRIVLAFARHLFLLSGHVEFPVASVALSLAHALLLRYPRARSSLAVFGRRAAAEDEVADLAMRALRDETAASQMDDGEGDGSWVLSLLGCSVDVRLRPIVSAVSSTNIVPLTLRIGNAKHDVGDISSMLDSVFMLVPKCVRVGSTKNLKTGKVPQHRKIKKY